MIKAYNINDDEPVYYGTVVRRTPKSVWLEYKFENGYVETLKWTVQKNGRWCATSKPGSLGTDQYTFKFKETV